MKMEDLPSKTRIKKKESSRRTKSYAMVKQVSIMKQYKELANNIVTGEVKDEARDLM